MAVMAVHTNPLGRKPKHPKYQLFLYNLYQLGAMAITNKPINSTSPRPTSRFPNITTPRNVQSVHMDVQSIYRPTRTFGSIQRFPNGFLICVISFRDYTCYIKNFTSFIESLLFFGLNRPFLSLNRQIGSVTITSNQLS